MRQPPRPTLLFAVLLVCGLAAAPAGAQTDIQSREGIALRDQIAELRHQVQQLQDAVARGGGGSSVSAPRPVAPVAGNDMTAQLLVRIDQLEDQVRQLRGRIDELQNQQQQQAADLGKRIDDLQFLVMNPTAAAAARRAAEAGGTAAPPAAGAPSAGLPQGTLGTLPAGASPAAPAAQPPRTPETAMQQGTAALARRDYAAAEAAAREVLASRASPRAYDAQFLLAQAQFGQRQYSQAALSYDDTYNRARKGAHAEDALLGLANSLTSLGDKTSACQALAKLHAEFPTGRADLREPVAAARQRAGCK